MPSVKTLVIGFLVGWAGYKINQSLQRPAIPKLNDDWWGPGEPKTTDTSIRPFMINVSESILEDLKIRLAQVQPFTPPLEGIEFQYGFNTNTLKKILEYWKNRYNWRDREAILNKYPQFITTVQGLDIHYLHVRPTDAESKRVLPLLLLHGWPGSVKEFYSVISLLLKPRPELDFMFELIIPSLPGYGFSQGTSKPGLGPAQVAVLFKNFMKQIGYEKFYVQGGDWGSTIATHIAILFPEVLHGIHLNVCHSQTALSHVKYLLSSFTPSLFVPSHLIGRIYPPSSMYSFMVSESGYMHIQATKPDTVGVALSDSPIGLAAYVLEKFSTWTNPTYRYTKDGGLTSRYSYAELLDIVMIYWINNAATTSMRFYAETFNKTRRSLNLDSVPVQVPTACARFKNELVFQPEFLIRSKYPNLIQLSDFSNGGHFPAFEVPKLLANDVWRAFAKLETKSNE